MAKQIRNSKQIQGGDDCLLSRNSNSKPPASVSIPLYKDKGFAIIDSQDSQKISKHRWYLRKKKTVSYAITSIRHGNKSRKTGMHNLILIAGNGLEIDHIDGNGLNNRRSNLRVCTRSQNLMNMRKSKGSSKYKGVHWRKDSKKWRAYIMLNYKQTHLGFFNDETEAAKAYNDKAKELFGRFANLNIISDTEK